MIYACTTESGDRRDLQVMKRTLIILSSVLMIVLLPAAGILLSGGDISYYMSFPPATRYVIHGSFSLPVFLSLTILIFLVLCHPVRHIIRSTVAAGDFSPGSLPWWGYAGICSGIISWIIAWTRLPLMHSLQRWTFVPLWISFIIVVNALCMKRTGRSLLTHRRAYILTLFPLSAGFWWIFEYLNRFTANWYYTGTGELSAARYFLEATVAFSTVLPAVMSTGELVKSYPQLYAGMDSYMPVINRFSRITASVTLSVPGIGLILVGIYPEWLFPLLWISPLVIILSILALSGEETILCGISSGDWRVIAVYSIAALICGFFWEMWNIESQAKWIYSIPFVHRFKIFEMPVLGYAGYLPFGLECAAVAGLFARKGDELWRFR